MHPLLLLPAALVGFLTGSLVTKKRKGDDGPRSPLPGVPLPAWEAFVATMAVYPKGHVDKRYRLGTFGMDARKLKDVGVMETASKGVYGDEAGVWMGRWAPGLTEKAFLGSMPLQYAAFIRSMRAAAPKVSRHVGVGVDGTKCSLSGLLGVAHAAGEAGVPSWVADAQVRRRFGKTTEVFKRTNQIF
jgi:hypothetical protein